MRRFLFSLVLSMLAGSAVASPSCTNEPKNKWLSQADMKARLLERGIVFKVFKVTPGNCYEIYGRNKAGQRIEIYFNPVTGAIVEEHDS